MSSSLWPPWTAAHHANLSSAMSQSLLKFIFIESGMLSNHLILCFHLPLLASIFPSVRIFPVNVNSSHQVAKVWELQLQHQSFQWIFNSQSFPGGSDSKESACNAGDLALIPGLGRSHGEGNSYPLYYSCLGNSMDKGARWAIESMGL